MCPADRPAIDDDAVDYAMLVYWITRLRIDGAIDKSTERWLRDYLYHFAIDVA